MAANFYLPHVMILPEDDANRQMAIGFSLDLDVCERALDILGVAGGWRHVVQSFLDSHVAKMESCPTKFMILLVDFDGDSTRYKWIMAQIPSHLIDRVFILGTWSEPEKLKKDLGSFSSIGLGMAKDCKDGTNLFWGHKLLQNNQNELQRMRLILNPVLFNI